MRSPSALDRPPASPVRARPWRVSASDTAAGDSASAGEAGPVASAEFWDAVARRIERLIGLQFSPSRHGDLRRQLAAAAHELGHAGIARGALQQGETSEQLAALADFAQTLLQRCIEGPLLQTLARHLTVSETYFFRDAPLLERLASHLLPELIAHKRRSGTKRLWLWSAGCCSGEEAYTLAILLHRLLPDPGDWDLQVLGTDLNAEVIGRAEAGVYGEWSFRGAPEWLQPTYFDAVEDGRCRVKPMVRAWVRFSVLNLVDLAARPQAWPQGLDLIACRNVLMYFSALQRERAIEALRLRLTDGGWLMLGSAESPLLSHNGFQPESFDGVTFFRRVPTALQPPKTVARHASAADVMPRLADLNRPKSTGAESPFESPREPVGPAAQARSSGSIAWARRPTAQAASWLARRAPGPGPMPAESALAAGVPASFPPAQARACKGFDADAPVAPLRAGEPPTRATDVEALAQQARHSADAGRLDEALAWCERWLQADKLDAAAHYTRAVVLMEQGDLAGARSALQRAVFLQEHFVLAHFALGNLAVRQHHPERASRHFLNAQRALQRHAAGATLPDSQGLSCLQMQETLQALLGTSTAWPVPWQAAATGGGADPMERSSKGPTLAPTAVGHLGTDRPDEQRPGGGGAVAREEATDAAATPARAGRKAGGRR